MKINRLACSTANQTFLQCKSLSKFGLFKNNKHACRCAHTHMSWEIQDLGLRPGYFLRLWWRSGLACLCLAALSITKAKEKSRWSALSHLHFLDQIDFVYLVRYDVLILLNVHSWNLNMVQCQSDHCENSLNDLTGVSFLESHMTITQGMSVCVILLRTTLSIWCYFSTPDLQRSGFMTAHWSLACTWSLSCDLMGMQAYTKWRLAWHVVQLIGHQLLLAFIG